MARDLKKMVKEGYAKSDSTLSKDHEARFLERLNQELPEQKKQVSYTWWRMAAAIALIIGLGAIWMLVKDSDDLTDPQTGITQTDTQDTSETQNAISLGSLSPDLKKVEDYYLATINMELAKLPVSSANTHLVEGHLAKLEQLNKEYEKLNHDLNTLGPNEETINALIQNLQLRLKLLYKLKNKLDELKTSEHENEQQDII
ncbi:hypothetical protein [Sediminicola luteus]|uniref:Anti-sigma factor n=1 Tax=Sediminicola luteus TaxID=319238 RepID=A0A2A4GAY3_9FLAO|nr:hypothetical protein [Sediminicola luteus]PCE64925.1 hypothetical protein B7P33_07115 [Sediminicola luteus]